MGRRGTKAVSSAGRRSRNHSKRCRSSLWSELVEYRASERKLSLFCGDYFAFDAGPFDGHYDRGALIAMSPELRPRYAEHTASLLSNDATQFVITVEYEREGCVGPPFSVPGHVLHELWPGLRERARVDDTANAPPKFVDAGLDQLHEVVWMTGRDGNRA